MKTIVIMPAYNAENTLEKTVQDIPIDYIDEIILVDDASKDKTAELANKIKLEYVSKVPFTVIVHEKNKGYGGNQKDCYDLALKKGADIIIMLHPDYQYDPKLIKYFIEFIKNGYFDVMLGSRIRSRKEALAGGMPLYKYFSNRFLSLVQNMATGRNLSEWHTGMRAYRREVLEGTNYHRFSDDFIFDSQMLFAIVEGDYSIGDIPVPVRYFPDSSSINFKRSFRYGMLTLLEIIKFWVRKIRS